MVRPGRPHRRSYPPHIILGAQPVLCSFLEGVAANELKPHWASMLISASPAHYLHSDQVSLSGALAEIVAFPCGRNSLGILGVLRHPASLPAGSWQGSLLDTWLDAALYTPSGEREVPESTGGTCEGRVFFQGRQSSYKQWFFV